MCRDKPGGPSIPETLWAHGWEAGHPGRRDGSKDQTEQKQMFRKKWFKFIKENSLFELPIGFLVDSLRRGRTLEELTQLNAFLTKYDINEVAKEIMGL